MLDSTYAPGLVLRTAAHPDASIVVLGNSSRVSANQAVILRVAPNPEPYHRVLSFNRDCSVVQTNSCRPEAADFLEVKRWVPGIGFQQMERAVCQFPD
jgi:hypothetical protein